MINASANGWINKYFVKFRQSPENLNLAKKKVYKKIRKTGFIYGHAVSLVAAKNIETQGWTGEELAKVALLDILYLIYRIETNNDQPEQFVQDLYKFYTITQKNAGIEINPTENISTKNYRFLEKIIDTRVQTNNNIISKNFSHILTNAFLFVDVLAFKKYLSEKSLPQDYAKNIEFTILSLVSLCLSIKKKTTKYDELLIKLFENSVRYNKITNSKTKSLDQINWENYQLNYEKYYLLDIASMSMWSDGIIEDSERNFLMEIAEKLNVPKKFCLKSFEVLHQYILDYKDEIPYFNYSNPVKHFYDQSSQTVQLLISRNKKRLIKELSQSGELLKLLAQSTHRDLNDIEKKKVKNQLLDVCKSIPSLTIFLLPGGSLLLPVLIKFIPKMLPSAFNENLENE